MLRIDHISKYRSWIIFLGLLVGLAIVCQPVASYFFDSTICQVEKENQEDTDNQEKPETQISSFQAVTPAQQVINAMTDFFILEEIFHHENSAKDIKPTFIEKLSGKLIKVLFNFIISPNAP